MSELADAATVLVLVLAYLLILQALTAAAVLLAQFIVVQVRALWSLVELTRSKPVVTPPPLLDDQGEPYRIGGGLLKW